MLELQAYNPSNLQELDLRYLHEFWKYKKLKIIKRRDDKSFTKYNKMINE